MQSERPQSQPSIKSPFWRFASYIGVLALALGVSMLVTAVVAMGLISGGIDDDTGKLLTIFLIACFSYLCMFGATVAFARFVERINLHDLGLPRPFGIKSFVLGGLCGILLIGAQLVICVVTGLLSLTQTAAPSAYGICLGIACLLVGLTEETVCRGYLLFLMERWKGRVFAIASTAVFFWIIHIPNGTDNPVLTAFAHIAFSVAMALIRLATGSLYFPIAFHASYDWMAFAMGQGEKFEVPGYYRYEVDSPGWLLGSPGDTGAIDLVSLGLVLVFAIWCYRARSKKEAVDDSLAEKVDN